MSELRDKTTIVVQQRILKVLRIIEALKAGQWTVEELADQFKCSTRTILRYLDLIEALEHTLAKKRDHPYPTRYSIEGGTTKMEKRNVVLRAVAHAFATTPEVLKGPDKSQHLSEARRVFSYLARTRLHDSFPAIGLCLRKNHTSVMEGVQRMEDHIFMRDPLAKKLKEIEQELLTKQII